jgi:hypothetical protein
MMLMSLEQEVKYILEAAYHARWLFDLVVDAFGNIR